MSMTGSCFTQNNRRAATTMVNGAANVSAGGGISAVKQEVFEEMAASAIVQHGFSLSHYEQHKALYVKLNPAVKQIKSEVSKGNCLKVYEREKEKLKHELARIPGRVCLTYDVWNDPCTDEYLCLTVNYVDSNWKLQSKFLSLFPLPFPLDDSILQSVQDLLLEWGIEKKIFTVTLNIKRCGDAAQGMLRNRLNQLDGALLCKPEYFHVNCGAYFMDHMGEECFKLIEIPIRKIREGVHYVVGHEKIRLKFEEAAVKLFGEGSLEPLWSDCTHRWNSTYLLLERAVKYRSAFENVMIDDKYTGWHLTKEEWSLVEKICKLVKPFYNIANLFLGTEHPTANLYFIEVWRIGMLLMEALEDDDLKISNLAQRMKVEFDEYWESCSTALAFAIIFDPRYKFEFIKYSYEKLYKTSAEKRYLHIYHQLDRLFKVYREQRYSSEISESDKLEEFFKWSKEQELNSSKSKLDVYLDERKLDHMSQLDVLSWWKENERNYSPELTLMARNILSIPITSFPKDSVFGMGYRVEHRLLDGLWSNNGVETLIAARNWLYGYPVNEEHPKCGLMGREQRFWIRKGDKESDLD